MRILVSPQMQRLLKRKDAAGKYWIKRRIQPEKRGWPSLGYHKPDSRSSGRSSGRKTIKLYLGIKKADNACAYTYINVFNHFNGYKISGAGVDGIYELTEPNKLMKLNSLDSTYPTATDNTVSAWYDSLVYKENDNGPTIGATVKSIIESDGSYFKDSNGNGQLDVYEDWRETPEARAKDLVER